MILNKITGFFYFNSLRLACRKYPESLHTIKINGLDMLYSVRGPEDGESVLLLHGNGGSHRSMATQQMELALKGYRAYCPDSRGQGANTPLEEYHYADMAEDFHQFIDVVGLGKPIVAGWSDGGIDALLLEMAYPGSCRCIVAAGANLSPDCGPDFEKFKEWVLEQNTPIALMMLSEPNIDPKELAAIKCPCLITCGEKDLISPEHTALIANSLPDAQLLVVKGATHGSYIKRNPRLGKAILSFLERI